MVNKDFFLALEELETQKGINKEYFIESLESALTSAYKKNFGEGKNVLVKLNPDSNSIKVYSYKVVVDEVTDPDKEMSLKDAKLIKKSAKVGDEIDKTEVTPKNFGRIAAQTAKQVVMQRLREAERVKIMGEINTKQDELITVVVRRIEGENIYCDLGITECEGVLGPKDIIPNEKFAINSRIKVYVKTIRESFGMPYVQLSRSNVGFVKKLFELEVPEIVNGEVVIHNIVREAGYRTKIAVSSPNPNVDAIGACVGNKGMRVGAIIDELKGEKVDIVPYSENPAEFIASALSPATILHIELNYNAKTSLVIVPDDKLSLAIGKSGQNVRLAARLTGWKIDVKAKSAVPSLNFDDTEAETAEANTSETTNDLFEDNSAFEDLE